MYKGLMCALLCIFSLAAETVSAQQTCVQVYTFVNAGYVQGGVVYATGYWRPSGTLCQSANYDDGIGDIGFAPAAASVKFKLLQADSALTCGSGQEARSWAALVAVREVPSFARAGFFLVTFAEGHRQFFACPQMMFSDCGLQPVSECSANPSVPAGAL